MAKLGDQASYQNYLNILVNRPSVVDIGRGPWDVVESVVKEPIQVEGAFDVVDGADVNKSGSKPTQTPTGKRGSPIDVKPGTNKPEVINGRKYTGHSLDQMQGRGTPPSAVEEAIQNGSKAPGNTPGTTIHTSSDVRVITNSNGDVITVYPK